MQVRRSIPTQQKKKSVNWVDWWILIEVPVICNKNKIQLEETIDVNKWFWAYLEWEAWSYQEWGGKNAAFTKNLLSLSTSSVSL